MKKWRSFLVLLILALFVSGCTKKEIHNIAGKTYYSTVVETGLKPSQVWFGSDKSFVMTNYFSDGVNEISGKWSINENVITLEVKKSSTGDESKVLFEINDDHNIVLRSNIVGASFGQIYKDSKTENVDNTAKVEHKKYYNISQNSKNKSFLDLKDDNKFLLADRNDFGIFEYEGNYSIEDNMVVVKYNDNTNEKIVKFLIKEDKTLVLQNDLGVSVTGDIFDSNYSENDSNNNSNNNTNTNTGNVPCKEIKTLYNNYWAYKGVKNFNLEVTLVPSNTTDTVTYTSDDKSIVEVDQNGNCTAVGPGKTKIHIKCGNVEKTVNFETKDKNSNSDTVFTDYGTYYNVGGCGQSIELKKDGTFRLLDNISGNFVDVKGLYSREKDVLMFSNFDSFKDQNGKRVDNFVFKIKDNETLVLLYDLHGSVKNDIFKKMSEEPICGIEFDDPYSATRYVYNGASASDMNSEFLPYFELYEDQTFLFYENLYTGMGEYTGKCSFIGSNMSCKVENISFSGYAGDNVKEIYFTFKDDNTIILKTDLCMSVTGDEFKIK